MARTAAIREQELDAIYPRARVVGIGIVTKAVALLDANGSAVHHSPPTRSLAALSRDERRPLMQRGLGHPRSLSRLHNNVTKDPALEEALRGRSSPDAPIGANAIPWATNIIENIASQESMRA